MRCATTVAGWIARMQWPTNYTVYIRRIIVNYTSLQLEPSVTMVTALARLCAIVLKLVMVNESTPYSVALNTLSLVRWVQGCFP